MEPLSIAGFRSNNSKNFSAAENVATIRLVLQKQFIPTNEINKKPMIFTALR